MLGSKGNTTMSDTITLELPRAVFGPIPQNFDELPTTRLERIVVRQTEARARDMIFALLVLGVTWLVVLSLV
jgi:hypothetical protein